MSGQATTPVVLDHDTGTDDAMAIALAVGLPHLDVIGVTTVAGNVSVDRATENTLRVLSWLGAESIPVYAGMSAPLVRPPRDASVVHAEQGLGGFKPPPSRAVVAEMTAPEFMVRVARQRPGDLTFVCAGPLTNLAVALNLEPDLPRLLRRVVVMGGAFTVPGNVTAAAEFNAYVDPEAAAIVARSDLPLTYIGLDATHQVPLTRSEWSGLEAADAPAAQLVHGVCKHSFVRRGVEQVFLHDPLAVAVAAFPDLVTTEASAVAVDTGVGASAGQTQMVRNPNLPVHQVALGVDAPRFRTSFWETLNLVRP